MIGLDVSGKEWDVWNGRGGWVSRREWGEIVPAGLTDGSIVFRSVDCRSGLCRSCRECVSGGSMRGTTKEENEVVY